jgi:hypothetical protein
MERILPNLRARPIFMRPAPVKKMPAPQISEVKPEPKIDDLDEIRAPNALMSERQIRLVYAGRRYDVKYRYRGKK